MSQMKDNFKGFLTVIYLLMFHCFNLSEARYDVKHKLYGISCPHGYSPELALPSSFPASSRGERNAIQ